MSRAPRKPFFALSTPDTDVDGALHDAPQPRPFDASSIEDEIREFIPKSHQTPAPTMLPAYVEHAPETPEVGKLTAEAIVREYEETAKEVELMSTVLVDLQRRLEMEVNAIHQVREELKACAQRARDEGKAAFERIEKMSAMTSDVRKSLGEITSKLYQAF
jgi:hypothetical protein